MKVLMKIWVFTFYLFVLFGLSLMVYDAAQRHWAFGMMFAWLFGGPLLVGPYLVYRETRR